MEESYIGQLVVLRSRWNIRSDQVGLVVENLEKDKIVVMWTIASGIELKVHIKDALIPVTNITIPKIMERVCGTT